MKRYRKKAKLAMTVALVTSSVTYSAGNVFAQKLSESNSEPTPVDEIEIENVEDTIEEDIEIPIEDIEEKEEIDEIEEIEDTEEPSLESTENFEYAQRATESVEINETKFPDEGFREYIATTFDKNSDGVLSVDEINKITSIVIAKRMDIKSIEGIQYFPNLSALRIGETGITTLDVSQNTELTQLYCNDTEITNLDVSQNTKLNDLRCYKTGIESLDVSNNLALTSLRCDNTAITTLDVSQNSALTSLRCNNTGISTLDVSNNLALIELNCSNTQITSLDVSKNTALTELNCYSNLQLVTLQLDGAVALEKLQCQSTGITTLDVSKNPALTNLNCNNISKITSLDVSNNPALKELICYSNPRLVTLQLNGANALETLQCQSTGITTLDVSNHPALTSLRCDSTKITSLNVSNNSALKELNCSNTKITNLDVSNNPSLEVLTCSNIFNVTSLDLSNNLVLKELNCYSNPQLVTLKLDGVTTLEKLQCQNTGISNLDVSNSPALVTLNCNNTPNVTTLDLRKSPALKELVCYNNPQLTSLYVDGADALETLQCQNTGITTLDVTKNPALISLRCDSTGITNLDISNNTALTSLQCQNTAIASLDLSNHPALTELYCYNNQKLTSLNVDGATALQNLQCQGTRITKLNVSNNPELISLNCNNTRIADLDVNNNPALVELSCYSNKNLTNLAINRAKALERLQCQGTGISSLDVRNNPALTYLRCDETGITELDVNNNPALSELHCFNNPQLTSLMVNGARALTYLRCDNTNITSLDVSQNVALETLNCGNTKITALDVRNSPALISLICSNTGIADLVVSQNRALTQLYCNDTKITTLDVTNNTELTELRCYNTGIKSLDVSQNTALTSLQCQSTGITTLDVSNNLALTYLSCHKTKITTLDVSKNTALTDLYCYSNLQLENLYLDGASSLTNVYCQNIGITNLDVSNNLMLETLYIQNNNLGWLNIGDNPKLTTIDLSESVIDMGEAGATFNIKDVVPNIELDKTTMINATLDKLTGEVSGYVSGEAIKYEYDCGTSADGEKITLTVNLMNFAGQSSIRILSSLDKDYDGEAVGEPEDFLTVGSKGNIRFEWYTADGTLLPEAPIDAGNYKVKALLEADANYGSAETIEDFTIRKAKNEWIEELSIHDWLYGDLADDPIATAKFGIAEYTYSTSENGPFTSDVPGNVGTYYVKASVAETDNYEGLEAIKAFTIGKASSKITINDDLNKVYDGQAVENPKDIVKTGSTGDVRFEWYSLDGTQLQEAPVNAGSYKVKAILEADANYEGAEVEKEFTISQASSSITINDDLNKVYDGQAVEEPKNVVTTGSTGAVSFEWYTLDGTKLDAAPVNVGSYKVKVILEADANYEGAEVEKEFTISQASSSITINDDLSKIYDGQAVEEPKNVVTTGSTGAVSFEWYTLDGTKLDAAPVNVGSYKVKAILEADGSFVGAEVEKPFNITKATSTITVNDDLNKVYDGQAVNEPTNIVTTGSTGAISFEWYTLDGTKLQSAPVNAGNYKVKVILETDSNYEGLEVEKEFTISKASSSITINDDLSKVYDGQAVNEPKNIVKTGSTGAVSFEWYTLDGTKLDAAPVNAGSYKVKAILEADANYASAEAEKEFTISQTDSSIIINDDLNKVYDGQAVNEPKNIVTTGSTGAVSFEWYTLDGTKLDAAPVNAGSYKVKAILEADNDYAGAEVEKEFTISQATSHIIINDDLNKVYDGQAVSEPKDIETTGSTGAVSFEWYTLDGTKLDAAPVNAGSYKVKAILEADANYESAEVEKEFIISQTNSSITIHDDLNKVYDGQPVSEPKNIVTTGSTGMLSFEWYAKDGTKLDAAPVNAGDYKIKAILAGDANYTSVEVEKEFTISKANSSIMINDDLNKVYDGQAVNVPKDIETTGSTGAVTIEWYAKDGTKLQAAPVNAGSYKVKVVLAGDENYEGAEVEKEFAIAHANSSITIHDDLNKVYDGKAVSEPKDVDTTGSTGAISFEWYTHDGTKLQAAPVNAGSYKVKAILEADANYEGAEVEKEFTISQANSSITINDDLNKVYDGQAVNEPKDIDVTGSAGAVSFEWYTLDGTKLDAAPVNAGSYKVKAILEADMNYAKAEVEKEFTISQANSSIAINDDLSKVYDGLAVENPVNIVKTGSTGAVSFEWYTLDGTKLQGAPKDAGSYKVKAILDADENYTSAEVEKEFTISQATSIIIIHNDLNKLYDGKPAPTPQVNVIGSTGTISFEWYQKEEDTITRAITWTKLATVPSEVGEYKVVITVGADKNHVETVKEQEFSILENKIMVGQNVNGVVTNPDGSTIVVTSKDTIESNGPVIVNPDGSITFPNGGIVTREDGSIEIIQKEGIFRANPGEVIIAGKDITGVQTGDYTQAGLWTILVGLSTGFIMYFRRKNRKEER